MSTLICGNDYLASFSCIVLKFDMLIVDNQFSDKFNNGCDFMLFYINNFTFKKGLIFFPKPAETLFVNIALLLQCLCSSQAFFISSYIYLE